MTGVLASWSATTLEVLVATAGAVTAVFALYLLLVVVAALLGRRRFGPDTAGSSAQSTISVVIPAHDEEELVSGTVALRNQTYPNELSEIIVSAPSSSLGPDRAPGRVA